MMIKELEGVKPTIKKGAWCAASSDIIGDVSIGTDSSVWYNAVIRGDENSIHIGDRSNIQDGSVLHVTPDMGGKKGHAIEVGDDVTIGHNVVLHGCKIGDGSLIGMSSTVLDGAVIGKGCIVGAGSLVTGGKVFAPRSLIMGSPAKVVKQLSDAEVAGLIEHAAHYVECKNRYLKEENKKKG